MANSVSYQQTRLGLRSLGLSILAALSMSVMAQTNVTTYHNDVERTGLNSTETILTPSNVNVTSFGLLANLPVDGQVYAQPLYLSGVTLADGSVHNVVFIATEHNSVFAFDADTYAQLWKVNLGPSVPNGDVGSGDINPEIGITGTPVIYGTGSTATLLVLAKTKEKATKATGNLEYVQRLHSLSVTTGADTVPPVVLMGQVNGTGDGTDGKGHVPFNPLIENNRPALLLMSSPSEVLIGFASHGDNGPYHGFIFAYDPATLRFIKLVCTSPNAKTDPSGYPLAAGGIWQGGSGLASDGYAVYFSTGNGTFDPSTGSYGDSVIHMFAAGLGFADYFSPSDQQSLDDSDEDLGSGGVMVLPKTITNGKYYLIQSGKEGTLYMLDSTNLGKNNSVDKVYQELHQVMGGIWGAPAYFNNTIYYGPAGGPLLSYNIVKGKISPASPATSSPEVFGYPGPTPAVSANGVSNGIVWAIQTDAYGSGGPAYLHAYNASNLGTELYNSGNTQGRDTIGGAVKFAVPTIANGKVFVGTSGAVAVFGEGQWAAGPTLTPSGNYVGSVTVDATDSTPGAKIYYTTDGSTPAPGSGTSTLYTGPVTFSSSLTFLARAFAPGYGPSTTSEGDYQVNAYIGTGTGLEGAYYNNSQTPSGTPTATRLDSTINFNWNGGSPISGVAGDNWAAEWTGYVTAETTSTYTFYTNSDDGVSVTVNGVNIINDLTYHAPTIDQGSINLVGGQKYSIVIDYFQGGGGSLLQLFWSAPGMPEQIVPQSQLSPN